jgi:hypothetical protein
VPGDVGLDRRTSHDALAAEHADEPHCQYFFQRAAAAFLPSFERSSAVSVISEIGGS